MKRTIRLAVLGGLLLFFCPAVRSEELELIIVSPHWEGVQYEFGEAFSRYFKAKNGQSVHVRWRDLGGTSAIEKALDALYAGTPQGCGIDLFFGGGMDPYEAQKRKGHLQSYKLPKPLLAVIPPKVQGVNLIDPDFTYYGAALSSFGIVQNLRVLQTLQLPEVQTWEDLTRPELDGWVSFADPRKSGSVHMIDEVILQAYGWDKGWSILIRMGGNIHSFLQASAGPTKEVSIGNAACAPSIDINGLTQVAFLGKQNIRYTIPPRLSVVNPDGIAILKGAPHLALAQEFINFVLSEPGQSLWMHPQGTPGGATKYGITRMGILPSQYTGDLAGLLVPLNPFAGQVGFLYNNALGSQRWNLVNDLLGQTIIDVHQPLQAAWKAINRLPPDRSGPLLAELGTPFITEGEAAEYAAFWRNDRLRAARLGMEWMQQALQKYKDLEKKANSIKQLSIESTLRP